MAQKKLFRFAEIKTFSNVKEYPEGMPGQWHAFFGNNHPLVLELACGRGEYCIGLAKMFPQQNFLGVDIKGNRMYIGAKYALDHKLSNAGFLRTQIAMLPAYFAPGEADEIWITFPDPQLRTSCAKRRLTHPRFLRLYQQILKPGGIIHLKTDSPQLYFFTLLVAKMYNLDVLSHSDDIYASPHDAAIDIKTHYESLDIAGSKRIHYIRFTLPAQLPNPDNELQEFLKQTENQSLENAG